MNDLTVTNLSKSYGDKDLFSGLTFSINQGEKVALIANNGIGKSSLMRIITGDEKPDEGEVEVRKDLRLGYLEQSPNLYEACTIDELIHIENKEILELIDRYEEALSSNAGDIDKIAADMDRLDAWNYKRNLEILLNEFSIHDLDRRVENLSGGQKKRLRLALVLIDHPDLLIMDEPTNHLDLHMIEWLEDYLSKSKLTLLMVTHDRYFLDAVCSRIIEIEEGKLYRHNGNYSYFLEKRMLRDEIGNANYDKTKKRYKKELEWMRRSPKARTTKAKSRISAFHDTAGVVAGKKRKQEITLEVKAKRVGGKIMELKKIRKAFDDLNVIDGFTYTFNKGDRIGVVGANGSGKTTLMNIITGQMPADTGKRRVGETIEFGYYRQEELKYKPGQRVIEFMKEIAEVIERPDGSKLYTAQFLELFNFSPEMQFTPIDKLSGGEKKRLQLLTVLIRNPNFLILDEPTNDLDLITLTKLEEFLETYQGCLMLVSHDRYFMDTLVDHLFVFAGDGQIEDHYCTYTEYRLKLLEAKKKKSAKPKAVKPADTGSGSLSFEERKEYKRLQSQIEKLESKKRQLQEEMANIGDDYERLMGVQQAVTDLDAQIDEKSLRWMELAEREAS